MDPVGKLPCNGLDYTRTEADNEVIGYFQALAEWRRKRSEALKSVRTAYDDDAHGKRWWQLLPTKAKKQREAETGERLRLARNELFDMESTKPERPDDTRELFLQTRADEPPNPR